jgi:hypothetical protein
MSIKTRLIRGLIGWLNRHYPFLCRDIVVGVGRHVHRNPTVKRRVVDAGA